MDTLSNLKKIIQKAYEAPLTIVDRTAKEVIAIEREYFYGDRHNRQRLERIRRLLNDNFSEYKDE